jgi:ectoine hydroxylase-related dioxygenase (phytanoyl-CoA dioxygenase family)
MASQIDNAFKSNPSHDELRAMDRDLHFYPSRVEHPTALSAEDVAAFNRDGYLKGIRICDEAEITGHRVFFNEQLAKAEAAGLSSFTLSSAHLKYAKIYDLMHHAKILACVADILGPEMIGLAAHYFCKMPNDGTTVAWHQDASYWPLTPSKTATVWLAIDDADIANGCMRFVSGSHHAGQLEFRASEASENNVLSQTVDKVEQYGNLIDVELSAGEISIHSDLLLHSSHYNESDRRRCGLTLRYCTPDVRAVPGFNWEKEGVLINANDPDGHWGNPPRPERDFEIS